MLWRWLVVAASWTSLAAGTLPSATNVELYELAGAAKGAGDRQRLSLRHFESMRGTSLGRELDSASSDREDAFRAALDLEWALLASKDKRQNLLARDGGDLPSRDSLSLRSPFVVCTDRHPDAILGLESVVHRARTQLAYSRGDTACLLTGLRVADVGAVRRLKGVHVVEPIPHPAKLSHSLHAELEPFAADGEVGAKRGAIANSSPKEVDSSAAGLENGRARADTHSDIRRPPARNIIFNHGEGLPSDLDISLTPGTWGFSAVDKWVQHLASFDTTARLWDDHLRERLLWTRSALHDDEEARPGSEREGEELSEEKASAIPLRRNRLITEHGLGRIAGLWEEAADRSSEDRTCDFGRLSAFPDEEEGVTEGQQGRGARHRRGRGTGRTRGGGTRESNGEVHDRVVLRGAGSLGNTEDDNAHCLLTVLAYLMTLPEVAYIDDVPPVVPFNIEAAWITQSGQETKFPMWDQGIDGRTEIIAIADSGLDMNSCFFKGNNGEDNIDCSSWNSPVYDLTKRKVVQYVGFVDCEDLENGHGTHVGGSAAGALSDASPGEHLGDGSGFRAKLAVFDFGDSEGALVTPGNLKVQMLEPSYDIGARVSSNSWGAVRTTYTSLDRQMDNTAYMLPDMVIVVAAGNCGDIISGCSYQDNAVYGAGSILSPALGKNLVTVGASEAGPSSAGLADNVDEVAYFSSQGPTVDDGRIKPDVVAPGYHLFSASANPEGESCEIGPMAGTSMATPVVAGSAAMVRQYFVQGWYPTGLPTPSDMFNPSNALVKAMLVASGTAMASYDSSTGSTTLGAPPDPVQGFGRVLLDSVLNVQGTVDLYVEDATDMAHGGVRSYWLDMSGYSSSAYDGDMKVVMVWMEPAAASGSVAPVYNDLDLLVVAYDGTSETTFYPNNLAAKDPNNTVEMVTISSVDSYEWFNVTVTGASVTTSSLPYYALVVTGGVAGDYSPTSSTGRSWFVRWKLAVEGVPVAQAATAAFEASLSEAIVSETGDYTSENGTVLVKIDRPEDTADGDAGSSVTVEISIDSEADGYAVLTYVLAVVEGSSASADQGLAAALNNALESRTTVGCDCVATSSGGYDCSTCEEGEAFSTVESLASSQGDYDLLSKEGTGRSPLSVLDPDGSADDDEFWGTFAGGTAIRDLIRTDTYLDVAAVVLALVACTTCCGCLLSWRSNKSADSVPLLADKNSFEASGASTPHTPSRIGRKPGAKKTGRKFPASPTGPNPLTSGVTPAPSRNAWGESKG